MRLPWTGLAAVAALLLASAFLIGRDTGTFRGWVSLTIAFQVGGSLLTLGIAWLGRNIRIGRRGLVVVLLVGVGMRIAVLPAARELSDDAARYHWDGKAVAHGLNPYLHAPDAPAVADLWTDPVDDRINHPWNRTCYPPLAQALFAVGYLLTPGRLLGLQLLNLLAEIIAWLLLASELARRRRPPIWLLPLVWSPLLVCQGYLPGHLDLLTLPLVALAIRATGLRQGARSGLWLAAACLIKPLPLLILPAVGWELGLRRTVRMSAVFVLGILLAYVPFRTAGAGIFASTWLMATDWSFNGSVGAMLESTFDMRLAHLLSGVLIVAGAGLALRWGRDFPARAMGAVLAFVAFTPTLFPWYLISALPLLVLRPQAALISLAVLIPLSDLVVIDHQLFGTWQEQSWVRWVQYVPFYAILGIEMLRRRNRPLRPGILAVTGICGLALAQRLPVLSLPGPGRDEAAYYYWAHHPELAYAPLVQLSIRLAETVGGHSLLALRSPVLLLGLAVLAMNDRRLAIAGSTGWMRAVAALAVALCPWQGFAGAILHPDDFLVTALLGLVLAVQGNRLWLTVIAAVLAVAAKPTGVIALPVAWYLIPGLDGIGPRRVWAARGLLLAAGLGFAATLDTAMLTGMGEFGLLSPEHPWYIRGLAAGTSALFLGGPVLWVAAGWGAWQRISLLRSDPPPRALREARAALATAGVLLAVFLAGLLLRGQFKGNWVLPAAVLLWPLHAPRWTGLPGRRWLVVAGLVLACLGSAGQILALIRPEFVAALEASPLGRGSVGGALAYSTQAGVRETAVSTSRTWHDHVTEYRDLGAFPRSLDSAWDRAVGRDLKPRWIVTSDYGLAFQLHWRLDDPTVRVAVCDDGVFGRTWREMLREASPGPRLSLSTAVADRLPLRSGQRRIPLDTIHHPVTGSTLRPVAIIDTDITPEEAFHERND